MINYEDYKGYLAKIGFAGNSLNTYPSYISQNKLDIFDTISGYEDLNDDEKLIKFSNENNDFKKIFDNNHNFTSPDTFSDLRSGARRYTHYLQYKSIIKSMKEYDNDESKFDLNSPYIYFQVFNDNFYPVKAICKNNLTILELENEFTTNNGRSVLKKIFDMRGKENIKFIDTREKDTRTSKAKVKNIYTEENTGMSLNKILYGPPGTGKTYNTINHALEIIDGKVPEKRSDAKARFEILSKAGQIEFVTFHQSYGYEEFVEGIKANTIDGNISYDVENGIFKRLCRKSKNNLFLLGQNIGKYQVVGVDSELLKLKRESGSIIPIPMYILNEVFDLIDKEIITTEDLNNKMAFEKMSISTEKFIINGYPNVFRDLAQYYKDNKNLERGNHENYILIIDEINRGNISKIFGELITLIEPSKRIGADEEIRLRLPYSNDEFGVPSNLYIIGTMNTADRSIALMDTALRRRFEFIEMMPNTELLDFEVEDVNIKELLNKINARVEYLYDRDHTIGHAYFMDLNAGSSLTDLNTVMRNKIIPLLQEYFYDDWEKIRLVLNDGFIIDKKVNSDEIFGKNILDDEYMEEDKVLYSIAQEFLLEDYKAIYESADNS